MNMLEKVSVGDREQSAPSYQISRRPISRIVIPTFIAEMALSRNFSGISKKALYSVPSFFWSLNFILSFACWSFCALRTRSSSSIFAKSPPLSSQIWIAKIGFSVSTIGGRATAVPRGEIDTNQSQPRSLSACSRQREGLLSYFRLTR